jgi:hypothetical protein
VTPLRRVILVAGGIALLALLAIFFHQARIGSVVGKLREEGSIELTADDVTGLRPGTEIKCRGFTLGHVRVIEPLADGPPHRFAVRGRLAERFHSWRFQPEALADYEDMLGPRVILLQEVSDGVATGIHLVKAPGMSEALAGAAAQLQAAVAAFNRPAAPPPGGAPPTQMEAMVAGLSGALTDLRTLTAALARAGDAVPSDPALVADIRTSLGALRGAMGKLDSTIATLVARPPGAAPDADPPVIADLKITLQNLRSASGDMDHAMDSVQALAVQLEHSVDSLFGSGKLKGADSQFVKDIKGAVAELEKSLAELRNVLERTGDTGFGRMLIRKKPPEPSAPANR